MGSLAFVAIIFAVLVVILRGREAADRESRYSAVAPYLKIPGIDFADPRDRAAFRETLDLFHPDSRKANDSLLAEIEAYRQSQFTDPSQKSGAGEGGLTWESIISIGLMFLQFILVYGITLAITFYGAQTLGTYRFVTMKQGGGTRPVSRAWPTGRIGRASVSVIRALPKGLAYALLFSPAYVTGYSFKASFEGNSLVFMILLGVFSNGLLLNYANKFTTLLVTENRKGYVETALVKGLSGEYRWNLPGGVTFRSLLRLPRRFPGHVLEHLYRNARHQYLSTLKEQASFLITGLIIIEMALNIQGHLCYALLQNILYRRYDVALTIIFLIFLLVQATELLVDLKSHRERLRYEGGT